MDEKILKSIIGDFYCQLLKAREDYQRYEEAIQALRQVIAEKDQEIANLNQENEELRISSK